MSVLSVPVVGDFVARLLAMLSDRAPKLRREFADLPVTISRVTAPTRHGDVDCTVYSPPGESHAGLPVYVNVHGGGFVIRFPEQDDAWCRYLTTHARVVVVNVNYGTAPRHRFPVPAEQVYDVVTWASGPDRDWDGSRLCVGGQSAGGSLAAAAARLALDNDGPRIALQVLHYPVLDLVTPPEDKTAPPGDTGVPTWMSEVFNVAYVRDPAQRAHPLASPVWGKNADGIEGIAPALVVTVEHDRLHDEGATYARKLAAVGSLVEHRHVPGVIHGYDIRGKSPEVTREMYEFIAGQVARAIRPT